MFARFLQILFLAVAVMLLLVFVIKLCVKDYDAAVDCVTGCSVVLGGIDRS